MLDYLLALSPVDFEHAVARLLPHLGYADVRRTGGAGDLGVDIVCYDGHGGLVGVQCKRFAPGNNVTSPNIQQFFGMLVHHGARHGVYVTTSSFTKGAFDLAATRDIRTVAGTELASLFAAHPEALGIVREYRSETRHPGPNVPVVHPEFCSDKPIQVAREPERAWLLQRCPDTPIRYNTHWFSTWSTMTEEEKRAWRHVHERLLALTPEQFRKACILHHVAGWEHDRPAIRLLENENASIKDFVVLHQVQPYISRCHYLPAERAVAAEQVEQFVRFAKANGWGTGPYSTTGLFSAGALLRVEPHTHGVPPLDGWKGAFHLIPDMHWYSKGQDFIALAQQPGWPKKCLEGTERRGLLGKLFG
jgi:hypothetical protein